MRVLHVISGIDPENGGPTNALLGLAAAQMRLGMQVTVASTWQRTSGRENAQAFRDEGVNVRMIGPAKGALSRHPGIHTALGEQIAAADVVHVHALWEEIQHRGARLCQRLRRPYVLRPCGALQPWAMQQGRLKKRLYLALRMRRNLERAAAIHCTTHAESAAVAGFEFGAPLIVEPNGVDLRQFSGVSREQGRALLAQLAARAGAELGHRKVVVFLGRLHPSKGLDVLVPAFVNSTRAGAADAMLVLAGPQPDDATVDFVKRTADEAGMADRIVMTGLLARHERAAALVGADLFALTSYTENFGISVVEALAAGCPVIISEHVEVQEMLAGAGVGEVIAQERSAASAALSRWLEDDEHRRVAGERARTFAAEHFDWDRIAGRWADHYGRLVGGAQVAGRF